MCCAGRGTWPAGREGRGARHPGELGGRVAGALGLRGICALAASGAGCAGERRGLGRGSLWGSMGLPLQRRGLAIRRCLGAEDRPRRGQAR
eukprot:4152977-Alexandrium_andersonii.AAC.1